MAQTAEKQRYVIASGQVCYWEEKAPYTPSGKGSHGVLDYRRDTDEVKCHDCGEWFLNIGTHIKHCAYCAAATVRNSREYKFAHGLDLKTPLCGLRLADTHRKNSSERLARHPEHVGRMLQGRKAAPSRPRPAKSEFESANLKGHCRAQLTSRYRQCAADMGYTPTSEEFSEVLGEQLATAMHAIQVAGFRSFKDFQQSIGFTPRHGGAPLKEMRFTESCLLEILREFYGLNGRLPRKREFGGFSLPGVSVFKRVFGSVLGAFEAAGLGLVARDPASRYRIPALSRPVELDKAS